LFELQFFFGLIAKLIWLLKYPQYIWTDTEKEQHNMTNKKLKFHAGSCRARKEHTDDPT
jgi:hypothetical protein